LLPYFSSLAESNLISAEQASMISPLRSRWALQMLRTKYLLIAIIAFVGKYLLASQFGLYEDDYLETLPFFSMRLDQVFNLMWLGIRTWPHGEPIGASLNYLYDYLITRFDSLLVPHLFGVAIVALNGCLFYRLAKRLVPDFPAFVAACVFVLYPVDTSEQVIIDQFWQMANLTFVLLAFLFYRRNLTLSYAFALCSLLTYEHFFFPFAAAPFLLEPGEKFSIKRCLGHAFFIVTAATGLILSRNFMGEPRAEAALTQPGQILTKIPSAVGIGLTTTLTTTFRRTLDAFLHGDFLTWGIILLIGFCLVLGLRQRDGEPGAASENSRSPRDLLIIAAGSLFAAAVGYVLAFRPDDYPPIVNLGRLSGFNAPASIGVCLLVGCLLTVVWQSASWGRRAVTWGSIAGIAALTAVGVYIQRVDYVGSWAQQKSLLRQLLASSGTWKADTTLIIDLEQSDQRALSTPGFRTDWISFDLTYAPRFLIDYAALPKAYLAPGTTVHPAEGVYYYTAWRDQNLLYPRAIGYSKWTKATKIDSGCVLLESVASDPLFKIFLRDGNFQLFRFSRGRLERITDPTWTVAGVSLKQDMTMSVDSKPLPLSGIGKALLGDPALWPSVDEGRMYPYAKPFKDLSPSPR
jgi:hypothetical protein